MRIVAWKHSDLTGRADKSKLIVPSLPLFFPVSLDLNLSQRTPPLTPPPPHHPANRVITSARWHGI
jgi:hypothetical protein